MATEAPTEPTRRRSTVRERAPVTGGANRDELPAKIEVQPAPPPEPTATEANESSEAEQPRRSGWWSRRFAGC
jgi:ribonuclease E